MDFTDALPGIFLVLEGIDGSGKTTTANRLAELIRQAGREVVLTREPGGTEVGERIRAILLDSVSERVYPETEALLFTAARAQHVSEVIRPALARGAVVICDRFVDSSLAYQWGGRGLSKELILAAQRLATGGLEPDLKILLDLPVEVGLCRRLAETDVANRLDRERVNFHERVRAAYHALVTSDPERWRVVDAAGSVDTVLQVVVKAVSESGLLALHSPGIEPIVSSGGRA